MNCHEVQKLLSPYVDNMLEKDEMNLVSQHLKNCNNCSHEYERLLELISVLKSLGDEDLPKGFEERLVTRLKPLGKRRFVFPAWMPVGAVAAVLIVLFLGFTPGQIQLDETIMEARQSEQAGSELNAEIQTDKGQARSQEIAAADGKASRKASIEIARKDDKEKVGLTQKKEEAPVVKNDFGAVDTPQAAEGKSDGNGSQEDGSVGATNGENGSAARMFKAGSLTPEEPAAQLEAGASASGLTDTDTQLVPFMHLRVDTLESVPGELADLAKSLKGDIFRPNSLRTFMTEKNRVRTETYVAVIPCSFLKAFVDNVSALGLVMEENVSGSQELTQTTGILEINIIVEEKGN